MRILTTVALAMVLPLGACGGSDDPPAKKAEPDAAKTPAASAPAAPQGTPVPQAISSFQCSQDAKKRWTASAVIGNDTKNAQKYRVTVYIGPPGVQETPARTKEVGTIQAGGSLTVRLTKIPGKPKAGPCHVQVLESPA